MRADKVQGDEDRRCLAGLPSEKKIVAETGLQTGLDDFITLAWRVHYFPIASWIQALPHVFLRNNQIEKELSFLPSF